MNSPWMNTTLGGRPVGGASGLGPTALSARASRWTWKRTPRAVSSATGALGPSYLWARPGAALPGAAQRLADVTGQRADGQCQDLVDRQPRQEAREVDPAPVALLQPLGQGDEFDALQLEVPAEGGLRRDLELQQELVADHRHKRFGDVG